MQIQRLTHPTTEAALCGSPAAGITKVWNFAMPIDSMREQLESLALRRFLQLIAFSNEAISPSDPHWSGLHKRQLGKSSAVLRLAALSDGCTWWWAVLN
jgi:hypothetical protein